MTKRKREENKSTGYDSCDPVFLCKGDERVAISPQDLQTLREKGNVFGVLLDAKGRTLFREFRIPARLVCELKRAAKGTLISNDLDSLANAADLLGGFSFMDDLVKEDRLKSALPRTPKEDINRKYDWRTLYKYDSNFGDDLRQAQKDGYIFAADVGTIYHLNKKRKEE